MIEAGACDRGQYLLPDLPKASYDLWVRGYGLVDGRDFVMEPWGDHLGDTDIWNVVNFLRDLAKRSKP